MLITLFKIFLKIGLFTFGGGYGMISLVHDECVEKMKFLSNDEFLNVISISESTPGPIAVNMATYIGYKKCGIKGAIVATISVVLPSLIIIFIIANFLYSFLNIKIISYAFFGIRIAVSMIIIRTAYKLLINEIKNSKIKLETILIFVIYFVILILLNIFGSKINSVYIIISSIILGFILYFINKLRDLNLND